MNTLCILLAQLQSFHLRIERYNRIFNIAYIQGVFTRLLLILTQASVSQLPGRTAIQTRQQNVE